MVPLVAAQGWNQDLFPKIVFQVRADLYKTLHGGSFELIPRPRGQTQPELFTFGANPVQLLLNEMSKTFLLRFRREWYQSPGNYQVWGKSGLRSKSWFFSKSAFQPKPWFQPCAATCAFSNFLAYQFWLQVSTLYYKLTAFVTQLDKLQLIVNYKNLSL